LYSTEEEDRVSTDDLRERMSHLYQARIEMRQISPREVAKIIGGLGACGIAERCCSKFLTEFSPISIKHAKEQNLSLNPHDITGMCGRLRCCLVFEYEQYVAAKRTLPKVKSMIGTPEGQGKVVEVNTMRDTVSVLFVSEDGLRREKEFHREQLVPLEELKRLQEKALSGTCDKHEGGGCDCGRAKSGEQRAKSTQGLPAAAQSFIKANEARQAEEDAKARAEAVRERIKKRRDERDVARETRRANEKQRRTEARGQAGDGTRGEDEQSAQPSARPSQQANPPRQREDRRRERDQRRIQPGQSGQPDAQNRQRRAEQRPNRPEPNEQQQPQSPDSTSGDAPSGGTAQPNPQHQQQRRPLRRPLPRRKDR
jgi:hypothetical protein